MKETMKLLKKKMSEITIREFLHLTDKKGIFYEDITQECEFRPRYCGGSNDTRYGINTSYYNLGIFYENKVIFSLNASSFFERSIEPVIIVENNNGESFEFHWLDNGAFMIVKETRSK